MKRQDLSVVVTGGGSGLGAAVCVEFAGRGASVVAADLSFKSPPLPNVAHIVADACSEHDMSSLFARVADSRGRIDVLVCCAGVAPAHRVLGKNGPHDLDAFRRVVEINLTGTFNAVRLAAERMKNNEPDSDGQRGVIVMTASVAAFEGQNGQAAYAASKGAVVAMTLPLARELSRFGIRVCTIAPGIFETPMLLGMPQEVQDSLSAMVPFPQRFGKPAEYALLCRHITENTMLNGEVIRLDGAVRMAAK